MIPIKAEYVPLILIFGFIGFGILFFIIGLLVKNSMKKKQKKCTKQVEATIIDIVETKLGHNGIGEADSYTWQPVFEYEINGDVIRKRWMVGGLPDTERVGNKVKIYVNPKDINEIYYEDKNTKTVLGIMFFVSAILILFATISFVLYIMLF